MAFVLDASVTACWAFADESDSVADLAFRHAQNEELLVPSLWWFEVRNILVVNERRRRITEPQTAAFLAQLGRFTVRADRYPDESAVLRLARAYRLSVYDTAYLELAQREGAPLATLDTALRKAASAEHVALLSR